MNTLTISMCTMSMMMAGVVRAAIGNVRWMPAQRVPIWRRHQCSSVPTTIASEVRLHQPSISIRAIIAPTTNTWMCTMVAVAAAAAAVFHSHSPQHTLTHRALCTASKCRHKRIVLIDKCCNPWIDTAPKTHMQFRTFIETRNPWTNVHLFIN